MTVCANENITTQIRTSNKKSPNFVSNMIPFKASNMDGKWVYDKFVVSSYGWYPILIWFKGTWFENKDRYSPSTARQISHASRELPENRIVISYDEIKNIGWKICIARIHTEILIEELSVPLMDGSYLHSKEYFACAQPDCLDSEEFNLILFTDAGIKRACSIDFDFF